jgi:hypothetical protein
MTELRKEDISILDFIINELCKSGIYSVTCEYLAEKKVFGFGETKNVDDLELKIRDTNNFEIIAGIIEKSGKAKVTQKLFENPLTVSKNSETLLFKEEGGFANEYKKQNKKTWYNEPWIGYLIAFITLLFAFYQGFQNRSLEKDISSSKKNVETLKTEIDSLNIQFHSFESQLSDLKIELERKK